MPRLVDAHIHLQDPRLLGREDYSARLDLARRNGVTDWVCNGTSPADWPDVEELSTEVPGIHPSFGLHPWQIPQQTEADAEAALRELDALLQDTPAAGVGEIGLDKWIRDPQLERQKVAFRAQLALADKHKRSLTIHCLQAWGHLLEILKDNPPSTPFLLHSFGGPEELIPDFVELGAYFSLSPYFFHERKARQLQAFRNIPLSRCLLETDAPDMAPPLSWGCNLFDAEQRSQPLQGPETLPQLFTRACDLWDISEEGLEERLRENFRNWWIHSDSAD